MYSVTDPFNEWDDVLAQATLRAMRDWWDDDVLPVLQPSMVAAAGEFTPLNIDAILSSLTAWESKYLAEVASLSQGLLAVRVAEVLQARGVDLSQLAPEGAVPSYDMSVTLQAASAAGIDVTAATVVVTVPGWHEFIDRYAQTRRNMVVGMPETVYREVVTKLAAATKDGMGPWERARLTREFLSWEDEGGYDAWMTRAHRISRTETNNVINAGDLQAARMETAATGQELHKVWISTLDPRTRDTHFAADGQRVPLDGKFIIGGHAADHPSDSNLPAHEAISCRCSMLLLTPDETLPDESDRQTERERSDGTRRDPHAEVRARAERDVTRARDDEPQPVTAAAEGATPMTRTQWSGILAPIGKPTGDGRIFDTDAELAFREFPLPLMFQRATGDGHDTAVVVGKITAATIEGDAVHAVGEFFDNTEAADAAELVAEGVIRPSVDLTDMVIEYELTDRDGNPIVIDDNGELPDGVTYEDAQEVMHVRAATIMAATLVAKPAFAEAKITIGDEVPAPEGDDAAAEQAALLAAAAPVLDVADADAFADPKLTGPTPLTVTEDGWVFGHLALWGTEHIGMPGRSVTPPRSRTDYALFHTGSIRTTAGDLAVGRLTVGTGHAVAHANVAATTAHYDETGTCWAFVRAGEDAHGIFVAGVINPDANAAQVRAGAAAPLSGDWRAVGGNLELVAALSVNTPGFPVSRSYANTAGAELSLVASGVVPRRTKADEMADAVAEGLRRHEERKAAEQAALDEAMADAERLQRARSMKAQMLAKGLG